jgi:hypothetical protein
MITAKNIRYMIEVPLEHLKAIATNSKVKLNITGAEFLGLTNGGEFCYRVIHWAEGESASAKLFLKYNPTADKVIATVG